MQQAFEDALKQLARGGAPFYKRVGRASRCLAKLSVRDFPAEVIVDVTLLFSIFDYIDHAGVTGEYPQYNIPARLRRDWVLALHRIYKLLIIAKGAGLALVRDGSIYRLASAG